MTTNTFPIGAVVASAGVVTSGAKSGSCWALCDGSSLSAGAYGPLSQVIGTYFGGTTGSAATFLVPDLQGRFIRGVDGGKGRDPDTAGRTSPSTQPVPGNKGDTVGSVQGSAFISHTHTHTRHHDHHDTIWQSVVSNDTTNVANDTAQTRSSTSAGESDCRPINQYLNYLIKYQSSTSWAETLVGTVLVYAGDLSSSSVQSSVEGMGWQPCDDRQLDRNSYGALYSAIATIYGSSDANHFCVPDLRGRFIRGLDGSKNADPDSGKRTAPRPELSISGATGKNVGSIQGHAFPSHYHTYNGHYTDHPLLPNPGFKNCDVIQATYTDVDSNSAGNASETRPRNVALDHIIAWTNADSTSPAATFAVPPGAVIAYAGDIHDPSVDLTGWIPCDGRAVSGSTYGALYGVIGTRFGGTSSSFAVPDLSGVFVRGVDRGAGRDPGRGLGTYQADALANHVHGLTTHHGTFTCANDPLSTSLKTDTVTDTSSGPYTSSPMSSENRPINTYLYFLIKT